VVNIVELRCQTVANRRRAQRLEQYALGGAPDFRPARQRRPPPTTGATTPCRPRCRAAGFHYRAATADQASAKRQAAFGREAATSRRTGAAQQRGVALARLTEAAGSTQAVGAAARLELPVHGPGSR
jgi:hypothetical protein